MADPRLYLYRKAGRSVWDAEMWLPDGRRMTWRTGRTDRNDAAEAASERLSALLRPSGSGASLMVGQPEAAPPSIPVERDAHGRDTVAVSGKPSVWSQHLDAWFFAELKALFDN